MLNFGASKPRVRGGPPPWIRTWSKYAISQLLDQKMSQFIILEVSGSKYSVVIPYVNYKI